MAKTTEVELRLVHQAAAMVENDGFSGKRVGSGCWSRHSSRSDWTAARGCGDERDSIAAQCGKIGEADGGDK